MVTQRIQGELFQNELNESSVLSALIKSIRLRRTDEAVAWLSLCWRTSTRLRERAQRRLLIAAAEDNLSISVMQAVSRWFNSPARFDFESALRELLRITKTSNWYATSKGRHYICTWRESELRHNPHSGKPPDELMLVMRSAVLRQDTFDALHAFNAIYALYDWNKYAFSRSLTELAQEKDDHVATELASLFERNLRYLWNDGNYSGQCLFTLLEGALGEEIDPIVNNQDVLQSLANIKHSLSSDIKLESWHRDGIHCAGTDPRFSGTLVHMARACAIYEKLGRLDPNDDFDAVLRDSP